MKKFLAYLFLALLGTAAGIPYMLSLLESSLKKAPYPLSIIILIIFAQTTVLLGITIFFGLKCAKSTGFSTSFLKDTPDSKRNIVLSVLLGFITALIITIGDHFFTKYIPALALVSTHISIWKLLIVPLYGGIVEELLMRLFFVSFFVWLFAKLSRTANPINNTAIVWISIVLASLLFGIGHLPATSAITTLTPLVVVRAVLLNGIGGIIFGWMYWKKGLPYAMFTHSITDLSLFVLLPFLIHIL